MIRTPDGNTTSATIRARSAYAAGWLLHLCKPSAQIVSILAVQQSEAV